jgi:hypothetical protein
MGRPLFVRQANEVGRVTPTVCFLLTIFGALIWAIFFEDEEDEPTGGGGAFFGGGFGGGCGGGGGGGGGGC